MEEKNKEFNKQRQEKFIIKKKINYLEKKVFRQEDMPDESLSSILDLNALQRVEEYKNLILEQREIILKFREKLSQREIQLNEHQNELETYEQMLGDAEELLDAKTQ